LSGEGRCRGSQAYYWKLAQFELTRSAYSGGGGQSGMTM
jgi:hypothetical protein